MANMLVELKSEDEEGEKSKKGDAKTGDKSVPLSGSDGDAPAKSKKAKADKKKTSKSSDKTDDKESRLKRTLDRLMGRDDN